MKHLTLKLVGTFVFFLLSISTFAQLNWQKGGNDNTPGFAPPIIGTDNTWNAPLRFHTNGIQRMLIRQGGTGWGAGRIAIGNNLPNNFIPGNRLHV